MTGPLVARFTPVTPARLVHRLASWIDRLAAPHPLIGFDGPTEAGTTDLADAVADRLAGAGRGAVRVCTQWWWRPASLRLELGREDVQTLLTGWVDVRSLQREVIEPLRLGGGPVITRLRDPTTDRSIRDPPVRPPPRAAVLLDGPLLATADLRFDGFVHLRLARSTLARVLRAERRWWLPAFGRYAREFAAEARADVVVAYDHPRSPAVLAAGEVPEAGRGSAQR